MTGAGVGSSGSPVGVARPFRLGLEAGDEVLGLVPGEPSAGLSLGEAERATGVPEAGVAGGLDEGGQITQLARRGRWAGRLAERHGRVRTGRSGEVADEVVTDAPGPPERGGPAQTTRPTPARPPVRTPVIHTLAPVYGASIIDPPPTYMATCSSPPGP